MSALNTNLIDLLRNSMKSEAGIVFINESLEEKFISYKELIQKAERRGRYLMEQYNLYEKCEIITCCKDNQEVILNFWACVMNKYVPAPVPYPRQEEDIDRLYNIWEQMNYPSIITDDKELMVLLQNKAGKKIVPAFSEKVICTKELGNIYVTEQNIHYPEIDEDDVFMIQFSSGSTGIPKGIILKHKNIVSDIQASINDMEFTDKDVFLSWKPLSHDYGLIAFHIVPLIVGAQQIRMSTKAFMNSPMSWISFANKYRATIIAAPNFGYKFFCDNFDEKTAIEEKWDLSCIEIAQSGSERISRKVCDGFQNLLSKYKLKDNAMKAAYGLAENTLLVSIDHREDELTTLYLDRNYLSNGDKVHFVTKDNPEAVEIVAVGSVISDTEVRIAFDNMSVEGAIGEIQLKGNSVVDGYYKNETETQKLKTKDGWLRTGDLGFMNEGRLIVVGRIKETIILGGVNYYPQDIEEILQRKVTNPDLKQYAACGLEDAEKADNQIIIFAQYTGGMEQFSSASAQIKRVMMQFMGLVPDVIVPLPELLKTTSGKIQRLTMLKEFKNHQYDFILECVSKISLKKDADYHLRRQNIESVVKEEIYNTLGLEEIDNNQNLLNYGIKSLPLVMLAEKIKQRLKIDFNSILILENPTIQGLVEQILAINNRISTREQIETDEEEDSEVAVIGMALRFPGGVDTPEKYWKNLYNQIDLVTQLPDGRWAGYKWDNKNMATLCGGFVDDVDMFDAAFFNISGKEASELDPQQRMLLELSWKVIENAGYNPEEFRGSDVGVFIGISNNDYMQLEKDSQCAGNYLYTGNMFNSAAGRISYTFDFHGPSMAIDTACSSSIYSINQGCMAIKNGDCSMALVGAVNLMLTPDMHFCFSGLGALSESGRCRSFDNQADGYIRSEGGAVLLLKSLKRAKKDKDNILGIIKGCAVNHNGRSGGLTVPSGEAQIQVIEKAMKRAHIVPDDIDYIEMHGTGTKIGDPQELYAVKDIFQKKQQKLHIGSVKSNIGHLEAASGMAGIIKVLLAMKNELIPADLHFNQGNMLFDWDNSNLRVVDECIPWKKKESPRYAGITSLGISGSNGHLILASYEEKPEVIESMEEYYILPLSGTSLDAVRKFIDELMVWCSSGASYDLGTVCRNLANRKSCRFRASFVLNRDMDLKQVLMKISKNQDRLFCDTRQQKSVVFVYSGQGSQYHKMAYELYEKAGIFHDKMDEIFEILEKEVQCPLKDVIYGEDEGWTEHPLYTQLAVFAVEVSLYHLWKSIGITPDMVIGHSIGEFAAVYSAGILSLKEAVLLVYRRAFIIENTKFDGKMVTILADREKVNSLMENIPEVFIAAVNTVENITLSGRKASIEEVCRRAAHEHIFVEHLTVYQPFHSPLMEEAAAGFDDIIRETKYKMAAVPMYSTILNKRIEIGESLPSDYWHMHFTQTVCFSDVITKVFKDSNMLGIEIGANAVLSGLTAQNVEGASVIPTIRKNSVIKQLWTAIGKTWDNGKSIHFNELYQSTNYEKLYDLPNTVFDKKRFWVTKGVNKNLRHYNEDMVNRIEHEEKSAGMTEEKRNITDARVDVRETLYGMLSEILGTSKDLLNDYDNFFSFGADSLMLVQLRKQIFSCFGVEVSVKDFFTDLNHIEALCEFIQVHIKDKAQQITHTENKITQKRLSLEEKGILFLAQFPGGNNAYQNIRILVLQDKPDMDILKNKVYLVAQQHELLRCYYKRNGSDVMHIIDESAEPEYQEYDFRIPGQKELFRKEMLDKFDFSCCPLWRWSMFIDQDGTYKICFAFHHMIADNYATDIFMDALEAAYAGEQLKATDSYGSYIEKQGKEIREEDKKWWMKQLNPVPGILQLSEGKKRNIAEKFKGNTAIFNINGKRFSKAKDIIQKNNMTAFSFYLSVWALMLSKNGREKDFLIGTPFDHRVNGKFRHTIGTFVDTLLLRIRIEDHNTFLEMEKTIQEECLNALEHASYPFSNIVSDLGVQTERGRNPLFDVMFTYVNPKKEIYHLGSNTGKVEYISTGYTTFDLTISMVERESGITVKFDYAESLFEPDIIRQWIDEFEDILNRVIENTSVYVGELAGISKKQEEEILEMSSGEIRSMEHCSFRQIMRESFSRFADLPAISYQSETYTYSEVDKQVVRFAYALKRYGVEHGDGVAILLPLKPEVIMLMLAVQRLGAYWIPFDISFPKKRIEYMVEKSGVNFIICEDNYLYKDEIRGRVVTVEKLHENEADILCNAMIKEDDLAYVIFTSGSTGRPKGVALPQRALSNFLIGMKEALDWKERKRVACMTTPSFDIFLLESMLTLSTGGCVVIAAKEETISPERIADFILKNKIEYFQLTPTRLKLLDVNRKALLRILHEIDAVFVGGEQFPGELLDILKENTKQVYNVYGPTETCIWSTVKNLTKAEKVTIGRPILNTYTYVLDENLNILPPKVEGDLWIGGLGVAKEYLNDKENTEKRFHKNLFHSGIMYITGDRAKWEDNELVCLGRNDFQIKLRGYRIELEEIEKVILQFEGIHNAIVCVKDTGKGNKILVAFYTENINVNKQELKKFVQSKLPEYMVPPRYVKIDEFPQTQSGKIDRKQLVLMDTESHEEELECSDLIEQLTAIYKNVLGTDDIGLQESFFDMGGNSFSLVVLHSVLNETFGNKLDVTDLFADSSVLGVERFLLNQSKQKKMQDTIQLPADWINNLKSSDYAMTAKLPDGLQEHMLRFEKKSSYDKACLYGAVLSICIYKKFKQKEFSFWYAVNDREAKCITFDFTEEKTMDYCLECIRTVIEGTGNQEQVQKIPVRKREDSRIRICLGDIKNINGSLMKDIFDIVLEFSSQEGVLQLQSKKGMDGQKLTELLNSYMYLLNYIITQI